MGYYISGIRPIRRKQKSEDRVEQTQKGILKFKRKQIEQIVNNLKHHVTIYNKSYISIYLGGYR